MEKDMEVREVDPPLVLTMDKLTMCYDFVPNHVLSMGISITMSM
jgi:hypothetical protein